MEEPGQSDAMAPPTKPHCLSERMGAYLPPVFYSLLSVCVCVCVCVYFPDHSFLSSQKDTSSTSVSRKTLPEISRINQSPTENWMAVARGSAEHEVAERWLCPTKQKLGISWWSSGQASALSLLEAQVRSLFGDLRPCKPRGTAKKKRRNHFYLVLKPWSFYRRHKREDLALS